MGTAQNQQAVYAIERACINKTSVEIPPDDAFDGGLGAAVGEFNIEASADRPAGLVVPAFYPTKLRRVRAHAREGAGLRA
jgi:hypothetical protein